MVSAALAKQRVSSTSPRRSSVFVPRGSRSKVWFNRAYERAKADGMTVLDAAKTAMAATGGPADRINQFKYGAECLMLRGAVSARKHFNAIAVVLPRDIDSAIRALGSMIISETRQIATLDAGGLNVSTRDNYARLDHLRTARLVLRLMRRFGDANDFPELRDDVATLDPLIVAFRDFHQRVGAP